MNKKISLVIICFLSSVTWLSASTPTKRVQPEHCDGCFNITNALTTLNCGHALCKAETCSKNIIRDKPCPWCKKPIKTTFSGSPLFFAAYTGSIPVLQRMIQENRSLNLISDCNDHKTPLQLAIAQKHKAFALELIAAGADVNQQNPYGETALMWAAKKDQKRVIVALLAAGADKTLTDKEGKIAYDYIQAGYLISIKSRLRVVKK